MLYYVLVSSAYCSLAYFLISSLASIAALGMDGVGASLGRCLTLPLHVYICILLLGSCVVVVALRLRVVGRWVVSG